MELKHCTKVSSLYVLLSSLYVLLHTVKKNIFTKMVKDVVIEVPKTIGTRSKCSMLSSPAFACMHAALQPCFYAFWHFSPYILQHFSENAFTF